MLNESNFFPSSVMASETRTNTDSSYINGYPCSPAPPIEIKLFVGRVPRSMSEDDIRPIFAAFGNVVEVAIIRDRATSNHKGSAFVRMVSISQADAAIRELNNQKALDPALGYLTVKYAAGEAEKLGFPPSLVDSKTDQIKLFVGSIPKTMAEAELREVFQSYGRIDEVYIMKDSSSGMGKGCAFVKYAYKEQGIYALRNLDGKRTLPGCTRPLEVRIAEDRASQRTQASDIGNQSAAGLPSGGGRIGSSTVSHIGGCNSSSQVGGQSTMRPSNAMPRQAGLWKEYFSSDGRAYYHNEQTNVTQWDRPAEFDRLVQRTSLSLVKPATAAPDVIGPPGANVFLFHVPNEWTVNDVIGNFMHFGMILSARIATKGGRNRGFGFVSFADPSSAEHAVREMDGFVAYGKRLKVSIKNGEKTQVQYGVNASASSPDNENRHHAVNNTTNVIQSQPSPIAHTSENAAQFDRIQQAGQFGMLNQRDYAYGGGCGQYQAY